MISQQSHHDTTILRRGYECCGGVPAGKPIGWLIEFPRCCCHSRKKHLKKLTKILHFYIIVDLVDVVVSHMKMGIQYMFMYTRFCTMPKLSHDSGLCKCEAAPGVLLWRLSGLRVFFSAEGGWLRLGNQV
jgi:hypothetical protein